MINLYSYTTGNGRKPAILLEELKLPYTLYKIDISKDEQFTPEFIKINPNSKIPAIHDLDADIKIFESAAILMYLAEKTKSPLLPSETAARLRVIQWLLFQASGIGPTFGQFHHFAVVAEEKHPYSTERFEKEVLRLLHVLNTQLSKNSFIAGDYSIADIATYPYIASYDALLKIDETKFPCLKPWLTRIAERPAVKTGYAIFTDDFKSDVGSLA